MAVTTWRAPRARRFTRVVALLLTGSLALATPALAGSPTYPNPVNPTLSIAPVPDLLDSGPCPGPSDPALCTNPCFSVGSFFDIHPITGDNTAACAAYQLSAVNRARQLLGETPFVLPTNWLSLTIPEQIFVLTDMERVVDGYPPYLGLTAALTTEAQSAAAADEDPSLAPGFTVGTNTSGQVAIGGAWANAPTPLQADYYWMYDDGWSGSITNTANVDCTSPTAQGCWGHREEILGGSPYPGGGVGPGCTTCVAGTGYDPGNGGSLTLLIEMPAGAVPPLMFSWSNEVGFFTTPAPTTTTTTTTSPLTTTTTAPPPTNPSTPVIDTHVHGLTPRGFVVGWSLTAGPVFAVYALVYRGAGCQGKSHGYLVYAHQRTGTITVPRRGYLTLPGWHSLRIGVASTREVRSGCLDLRVPVRR